MEIEDEIDMIYSKNDFQNFLLLLKDNLSEKKQDWENHNLESYIEGIYGYVFDTETIEPSWKLFAEILVAGRVYE